MLEQELNIKTLDFNYIVSYVALIIFLLNRMEESRRCKSLVQQFIKLHEMLNKLPVETLLQIKGTFYEQAIKSFGDLLNCEFNAKY